jgi:hypothetical protein
MCQSRVTLGSRYSVALKFQSLKVQSFSSFQDAVFAWSSAKAHKSTSVDNRPTLIHHRRCFVDAPIIVAFLRQRRHGVRVVVQLLTQEVTPLAHRVPQTHLGVVLISLQSRLALAMTFWCVESAHKARLNSKRCSYTSRSIHS